MHPNPIEGVEFDQSLDLLQNIALDKAVVAVAGSTYQLEMKAKSGDLYTGDLIRLQSEALPSRLKRGEKATKLTLAADEALGHHAGFIFDPVSKLLGMEIKLQAAGILKLAEVIGQLAHQPYCLGLPLLTTAGVNALAGTKNGTLQFRIADPASLNAVDPDLGTVRDNLVYLKEMVDGAYVSVSVGAGPRREGLKQEKLVRAVNWLLGERDAKRGKVRSVRVVQPHEAEPVLDFVNARFAEADTLPITGDPETDWPAREQLLRSALTKARKHVHIDQ